MKFVASIVVAVWVSILPAVGTAAEGNALLQFAKAHRGLFPSEVTNKSVFARALSGNRVPLRLYRLGYQDAQRSMYGSFYPSEVYETCVTTGSGKGVTVMGVPLSYRKERCDEVVFSPQERHGNIEFTIPATPAQFRHAEAEGIDAVFTVLPWEGEPVVSFERVLRQARLDQPKETDLWAYTVKANMLRVELYLKGAKAPLHVIDLSQQASTK